jgi:hypothetical protein
MRSRNADLGELPGVEQNGFKASASFPSPTNTTTPLSNSMRIVR